MKFRLLLIVTFFGLYANCSGQHNSRLDKWSWLTGEWKIEKSGLKDQEIVTFSFIYELERNIIIRKRRTSYPGKGDKPDIHEDLMIIYPDKFARPERAIYFDNEGQIIYYKIAFEQGSMVFTNYDRGNSPVYRLTYTPEDSGSIKVKEEISRDGEIYITSLEESCKRVK
jgi:hypothetical protein